MQAALGTELSAVPRFNGMYAPFQPPYLSDGIFNELDRGVPLDWENLSPFLKLLTSRLFI